MKNHAEEAVISAILSSPTEAPEITGRLKQDHFDDDRASRIFLACKHLAENAQTPTKGSVMTYLADKDLLSDIEYMEDYLDRVQEQGYDPDNVEQHILSLRTRRTKKLARKYTQDISSSIDDAESEEEVASLFGKTHDLLVSAHSDAEAKQIGSEEVMEKLLEKEEQEVEGLKTGLDSLDQAMGGLRPGSLTTFVGITNSGKSVMLNQIGLTTARRGIPVLHINTEMSQEEILVRCISQMTGINPRVIERGKWKQMQNAKELMEEAREELAEIPYYFHYMPKVDYDKIYNLAVRYIYSHDVKLLVLDHVKEDSQLARNMEPYRLFGKLANKLKNHLAGNHEIAVITAQQGKRVSDTKKLRKEDVQDSIRIVQESSNVVTISNRKDKVVQNDPDGADKILLVDKARNAKSGAEIRCKFDPTSLIFIDKGMNDGMRL